MRNEPVLRARTIPGPGPRTTWGRGYNLTFRVEGGLHHITSNRKPYFSLTCWKHRKGFPNQCQSGGCNHEKILKYYPELADLAALHLSDIDGVPMHAEANGWYQLAAVLPGNAGERYHAGGQKGNYPKPEGATRRGEWDDTDYREPTSEECLQRFAEHVRVDLATAGAVRDLVIREWIETRAEAEGEALAVKARTVAGPEGCAAVAVDVGDDALGWTAASWKPARKWFAQWIEEQKPRWKAEADACTARHSLKVYGDPWPAEGTAA